MTDGIVSALIAALAGMGVGGGGLLVIFLTFMRGYETHPAQSVNLAFFILSAAAALPFHFRKRVIPWRYVAVLTLSAVPGVLVGCRLARCLSDGTARAVFGWFLLLSGGMMLFGKRKPRK